MKTHCYVSALCLAVVLAPPGWLVAEETLPEFRVSAAYSESTPGWGVDRFASIQTAINQVGQPTRVVVEPGVYSEPVDFGSRRVVLTSTAPDDPAVVASTVIDGQSQNGVRIGSGTFFLEYRQVLRGFTIRNGQGVRMQGNGVALIEQNAIIDNLGLGARAVAIQDSSLDPSEVETVVRRNLIARNFRGITVQATGRNIVIDGNIIINNPPASYSGTLPHAAGIHITSLYEGPVIRVINNTIAGNASVWSSVKIEPRVASWSVGTQPGAVLRNNIISGDRTGWGIDMHGADGPADMKYCNVWGNAKGDSYRAVFLGLVGNMSVDPKFADPDNGDYRLKSLVGRWSPATGLWVADEEQSPCIAAGDPESPFAFEPGANGGRINMGAYGNTPEASQAIPIPMVTFACLERTSERARWGRPGWFVVNRSGPIDEPLEVRWEVWGDAEPGLDYIPLPEVLSFAAGQASLVLPVRPETGTGIRTETSLSARLLEDSTYILVEAIEGDVVFQTMPYENWLLAQFTDEELAFPETIDPFADPGDYGVSNFLRYAHGLDPRAPSRDDLPFVALESIATQPPGTYLTIRYRERKNAQDLQFIPEYSLDLRDWRPIPFQERLEQTDLGEVFFNRYRIPREHRMAMGTRAAFLRLRIEGLNPLLQPE